VTVEQLIAELRREPEAADRVLTALTAAFDVVDAKGDELAAAGQRYRAACADLTEEDRPTLRAIVGAIEAEIHQRRRARGGQQP
jgi:hypothetical protein